jgi:hypothetical protein
VQERLARLEVEIDQLRRQLVAAPTLDDHAALQAPHDASPRLTLQQATGVAGNLLARPISASTLRRWCLEHGIGWQLPSSTWVVSKERLERFVLGGGR